MNTKLFKQMSHQAYLVWFCLISLVIVLSRKGLSSAFSLETPQPSLMPYLILLASFAAALVWSVRRAADINDLSLELRRVASRRSALSFRQFCREAYEDYRPEIALSVLIVAGYVALMSKDPAPLLITMCGVQDAFKHNQARRNVIIGGGLILVCITLLSCVSSFMIYREGFADTPFFVQQALSLFAVVVVEGAFIWLVYGFTRAFSSMAERFISLVGMAFLVFVMLTNIITHFQMVKNIPLAPFQQAWLAWGAVSVFIAVLVFVLLITLADPVTRLMRLELRYEGRQQETIIQAKTEGLESGVVQEAMIERAEIESQELAERIVGSNRSTPRGGSSRLYQQPQRAYLKRGKA